MADVTDPLLLDLVEWVARQSRPYSELMEAWRTSCPRLTVWEDAVDRGYLARLPQPGRETIVAATDAGRRFLRDNGRVLVEPAGAKHGFAASSQDAAA